MEFSFVDGTTIYPVYIPKYFDIEAGEMTEAQELREGLSRLSPKEGQPDWKQYENDIANGAAKVNRCLKAYDDKHPQVDKHLADMNNNVDIIKTLLFTNSEPPGAPREQGMQIAMNGTAAYMAIENEKVWRPRFEAEKSLYLECRTILQAKKQMFKEWAELEADEREAKYQQEERSRKRQRLEA